MSRNRFYKCCSRNVQLRHAPDCEMGTKPTRVRTWNVTLLSNGGVQIYSENRFFSGTQTGAVEALAFYLREEWRQHTASLRNDDADTAGARTQAVKPPQPQSDDQVDCRGFRRPDDLKPRPKPYPPTPWGPYDD